MSCKLIVDYQWIIRNENVEMDDGNKEDWEDQEWRNNGKYRWENKRSKTKPVRPFGEKDCRRCSNEKMEDGGKWKTEVEWCYMKKTLKEKGAKDGRSTRPKKKICGLTVDYLRITCKLYGAMTAMSWGDTPALTSLSTWAVTKSASPTSMINDSKTTRTKWLYYYYNK